MRVVLWVNSGIWPSNATFFNIINQTRLSLFSTIEQINFLTWFFMKFPSNHIFIKPVALLRKNTFMLDLNSLTMFLLPPLLEIDRRILRWMLHKKINWIEARFLFLLTVASFVYCSFAVRARTWSELRWAYCCCFWRRRSLVWVSIDCVLDHVKGAKRWYWFESERGNYRCWFWWAIWLRNWRLASRIWSTLLASFCCLCWIRCDWFCACCRLYSSRCFCCR